MEQLWVFARYLRVRRRDQGETRDRLACTKSHTSSLSLHFIKNVFVALGFPELPGQGGESDSEIEDNFIVQRLLDLLVFIFPYTPFPGTFGNPTIFIFNDYLSSSAKNCSHFEFEPCETNIQPLRSMKAGKDRFQPCFCVCRRFSRALMLHIHISASRARSALIWISNISVCFTVTWGASVCGCVLGKTSKDETRQIIFYWFYHKTQRVTQLPKSRNKHSSLHRRRYHYIVHASLSPSGKQNLSLFMYMKTLCFV